MTSIKRFLAAIAILLFSLPCVAQSVSNARFVQDGKTIKIYYDLSAKADISIYLSTDGGRTFESSPITNVSGDVGKEVSAGKGKTAVWNVLASCTRLQGESICFKVRARAITAKGYVDLGLPSGTRWKKENEPGGFYTYDKAVRKFGDKMPTKEQLKELKEKCRWSWNGNGYKVTGPNGNSIVLPAAGDRDCSGSVGDVGSYGDFWSYTPGDSDFAWYLYFSSGGVGVYNVNRCNGFSVRLVQD